MSRSGRRRLSWVHRITRDGVLFTLGILGIVHETVIAESERPTLIILFAGMIGLPVFFRADERNQAQEDKKDSDKKDDPPSDGITKFLS